MQLTWLLQCTQSRDDGYFPRKLPFSLIHACHCIRHMTGERSLFNVFESKKGGNVTFGEGSKSQIKGKGIISLPTLPDITNVLYVESLKVNLLSIC